MQKVKNLQEKMESNQKKILQEEVKIVAQINIEILKTLKIVEVEKAKEEIVEHVTNRVKRYSKFIYYTFFINKYYKNTN